MSGIDIFSEDLIPLTESTGGKISVEKITGKKATTVLKWTKGVLPAVKIGGSWYTTKSALEEFVVQNEPARRGVTKEDRKRSVELLRAKLRRK